MNESPESEPADVAPAEALVLLNLAWGQPVSGVAALRLTLVELILLGYLRFQSRKPKHWEGRLWSEERTLPHDMVALASPPPRRPLPDSERLFAMVNALSEMAEPGEHLEIMTLANLLRERFDVEYTRFLQEGVYRDLIAHRLLEERTETRFLLLRSVRLRLTEAGQTACRRWERRREALSKLAAALAAGHPEEIVACTRKAGLSLVLEESFAQDYAGIAAILRAAGEAEDGRLADWLEALVQTRAAFGVGLTTFSPGLDKLQVPGRQLNTDL